MLCVNIKTGGPLWPFSMNISSLLKPELDESTPFFLFDYFIFMKFSLHIFEFSHPDVEAEVFFAILDLLLESPLYSGSHGILCGKEPPERWLFPRR